MKAKNCMLLLLLLCLYSTIALSQEKRTVMGKIVNETGEGLPGVTIQGPGKAIATQTNNEGNFALAVPTGKTTLTISYVGFITKTIVVEEAQSNLQISLTPGNGQLTDVVVTSLGIKKEQRKIGYATSIVTGQDIIKTAPTNFASALYGKAPGVIISSNPGGATSAVGVQIRGINSISFVRQPLLVVDGVIIRNGDANNEGYWGGNQRINANGILDINPENIESLTILKGAAASALYGSDANFGVLVVTTKNGRQNKGLGIEVNLSANTEKVAVVPDVQSIYGPGYDRETNKSVFGSDDDGYIHMTVNGQPVVRPIFRAYAQFGPKADGRDVYWWDGQMRPYTSQPNAWKSFYRTGLSTIANIAVSNATDKMNYRFSYTRNDYKGIQIGGKQEKNSFNFNSTYHINSKLSTDLAITYVNEQVHNRPRQIDRITNNFGGFFSPTDYMSVYFNKYQTTKGYKYVPYNQPSRDPDEAIEYSIRGYDFLDFLWTQLANSYNETTNRLIASATVNYQIIKDLQLRGRLGTDYTGYYQEEKDRSEYPIAIGPSGYYGTSTNRYLFTYGDVLLSYNHPLTSKLNLSASIGYQSRKEDYRYSSQNTVGGLSTENFFSMNASSIQYDNGSVQGKSRREAEVKDGLFGIVGVDFNNYLFVEGTLRRERTSTLFPGKNTFYYPSVSAAFELSRALNMPAMVTYSKLRVGWGIVGNPPPRYQANVIYTAGNINGVPTQTPPTSYGNNDLRNEQKHELEFGWETKLLGNRLGFDVSYYTNNIVDQILPLTIPASVGATQVLVNVGTLHNYGVELSLNGTPIKSRNFQWDTRINLSFNRTKVVQLMQGLDRLTQDNVDNGSLLVVGEVGKSVGDIMGYVRTTNANGQYIIGEDGLYEVDFTKQVKLGNILPKGTGGFINTINYKNVSLNFLVDFRWGQQVISPSLLYGMSAGLYKNTLFGRDQEHGGVAYYTSAGKNIQVDNNAAAGPGGEKIYHDGVILSGVNKADNKTNTVILDAASYYLNTFDWGSWPGYGSSHIYEKAVYNNDFIKLRELSLSYTLPVNLTSKIKAQKLTLTVYGRNLFYFYKTLPYLDPEEGVGTNYVSAARVGGGSAATRSIGGSLRFTF